MLYWLYAVPPWDVWRVLLSCLACLACLVVKLTGLALPGYDGRMGRSSERHETVNPGPQIVEKAAGQDRSRCTLALVAISRYSVVVLTNERTPDTC